MKQIKITETPPFIRNVKHILSVHEVEELKQYLAENPLKGDVIRGAGGARKMRWSAKGKGKRGGARIIYYYAVVAAHIYLISCYSKNQKENMDAADMRSIKHLIELIKKETV